MPGTGSEAGGATGLNAAILHERSDAAPLRCSQGQAGGGVGGQQPPSASRQQQVARGRCQVHWASSAPHCHAGCALQGHHAAVTAQGNGPWRRQRNVWRLPPSQLAPQGQPPASASQGQGAAVAAQRGSPRAHIVQGQPPSASSGGCDAPRAGRQHNGGRGSREEPLGGCQGHAAIAIDQHWALGGSNEAVAASQGGQAASADVDVSAGAAQQGAGSALQGQGPLGGIEDEGRALGQGGEGQGPSATGCANEAARARAREGEQARAQHVRLCGALQVGCRAAGQGQGAQAGCDLCGVSRGGEGGLAHSSQRGRAGGSCEGEGASGSSHGQPPRPAAAQQGSASVGVQGQQPCIHSDKHCTGARGGVRGGQQAGRASCRHQQPSAALQGSQGCAMQGQGASASAAQQVAASQQAELPSGLRHQQGGGGDGGEGAAAQGSQGIPHSHQAAGLQGGVSGAVDGGGGSPGCQLAVGLQGQQGGGGCEGPAGIEAEGALAGIPWRASIQQQVVASLGCHAVLAAQAHQGWAVEGNAGSAIDGGPASPWGAEGEGLPCCHPKGACRAGCHCSASGAQH